MADMTRDLLKGDLQALLSESAGKFKPGDLDRCLDAALADLARVRPLVRPGELTLVADQGLYAAPADLLRPLFSTWGHTELRRAKPWNSDWPGLLPTMSLVDQAGVRMLSLDPAPDQAQINLLGNDYTYRYSAFYTLGETNADSNLPEESRELVLIRALAAAMLQLANLGVTKPVIIGKAGVGGMPKNGAPAYLAGEYMDLFERMAR
jgi:hypothetical protein